MLCYFKFWLSTDENFSLNLINHSYKDLLRIDSMDVHPPLYYLIVKIIITPVLYFNHNFVVEIVLVRLLSMFFSLISFLYLRKISHYFHIYLNYKMQFLTFLMVPGVLIANPYDTQAFFNIRMYSLAAMFFVISFYYLLRYLGSGRNIFLYITLSLSLCAAYVHYYTAVMSGLLLLIYCVYSFFSKMYKTSIKLLVSGIVYLLSYMPWLLYSGIHQVNAVSKGYWIGYGLLFKNLLMIVVSIIVFLPLFIKLANAIGKDEKVHLFVLILINLLTLLLVCVLSILKSPILMLRYMYPSLLIFEFLSMSYLVMKIRNGDYSMRYCKRIVYMSIIPIAFSISTVFSLCNNVRNNIVTIDNFRLVNKSKNENFNADSLKIVDFHEDFHFKNNRSDIITQNIMYAHSVGKKIVLDETDQELILNQLGNPNFFSNLKMYLKVDNR